MHPDIGFSKEMKKEFKQFEIRLLGRQVGSSYVFHAYWKDFTADGRDNVGVYYSFSIPKDEIADKVTRIDDNPDLIIPIFRGVYSHWDRSSGTLKVREVELQDIPR